MKKMGLLLSCITPLLKQPSILAPTVWELIKRGRSGGLIGIKIGLLEVRDGKLLTAHTKSWDNYQHRLNIELKPELLREIELLETKPLISVLMPTYNTPHQLLDRAIKSIQNQWYPNWELCISDDGSSDKQTLRVLQEMAASDSRIKLRLNKENNYVSASTNVALSMAEGEYVVLIDHDDLFQPQALYRIAQAILAEQPDFIYSDEALITANDNEILSFMLRPQFSLERLRSNPYIVHFIAFRTAFLRELGGLNEKLKISQDYDLILRAAEKTRKIVHIPEILYLWRTLKTSAGHQMQDQVMETSSRILAQHLARCNEKGYIADSGFFNFFDTRYPLQQGLKVAIIIPTKNCAALIKQCVQSLEKTIHDVNYEIVIVNHQSDEEASIRYFNQLKKQHTVLDYQGPFNFSAINNYAVQHLPDNFTHYLFCNNDIEAIDNGWLERMLELGQKDDVAIVGAKLLYPDREKIQHGGVGVGIFAAAEHYAKFIDNYLPDGRLNPGRDGSLICNHEMSAVTAACMLIKSHDFKRLNGFDEQLEVGFGDIDLCLRARELQQRVLFCPHATLLHYESYSRGLHNEHKQDTEFFRQRWSDYMQIGDPYYNPNYAKQSYAWDVENPLPLNHAVTMRSGSSFHPQK